MLISNFHYLKPVKINDSKFVSTTQNSCQQIGPELACFYRESLGRTKFVDQQDGGRQWSWGSEVTQADQNDINSQWSLYFTDLDELLSEYEQHRSKNDIAIMENVTILLVPDKWGPANCLSQSILCWDLIKYIDKVNKFKYINVTSQPLTCMCWKTEWRF